MKKLFFCVAVIFLFANVSYSQEVARHLKKENSLSFKFGVQNFKDDDDLLDYWNIRRSDMRDFAFELGYEKKIAPILSIETSIGYYDAGTRDNTSLIVGDSSKIRVQSLYLSPTIKCNLPANDTIIFYFGAGPDVYYSDLDYKYEYSGFKYRKDESFVTFGAHGLWEWKYLL